jgi:hypothetical protein
VITYHTYDESGKHFLKETHWFLMRAPAARPLVPQQEEQISELKWAGKKDLAMLAGNTYPSILDVLSAGGFVVK